MRKLAFALCALFAFFAPFSCRSQVNFTAQDVVPAYDEPFGFGTNMGIYPPYRDEDLALLVRGTTDGRVPGIGANCIRPALPEEFLDFWGYTIRENTFKYYDSIGHKNLCVFLGYPSKDHRETEVFCPGSEPSQFFKNLYKDIWDGGANGTPVNDENFFALYVWKTVQVYGPYVKFWEIWNEPDFDIGGNAWKPVGFEGNWWENVPQPCETTTRAPIFHYIRMLRIAYEVIKSEDPEDLVCVGGIGHPPYLDVILRLSDNPSGGTVTSKFPKKGGAYFDCLSYHSYPHIEGATREWDNSINGFRHFRHSDACLAGVWKKKNDFDVVLKKYKFDGSVYPKKHWIITEFNIPRKEFGDYIGSDAAQVNFMVKTLATAPAHDIDQMYVYNLSDNKIGPGTDNEFSFMGLFKNLEGQTPPAGERNQVAAAFKTCSQLLGDKKFDADRTARLQLPKDADGVAFRASDGSFLYVLWAKTSQDRSESGRADYALPADLGVKYLRARAWDFSETGSSVLVNARQIRLTAQPVFLTEQDISESAYDKKAVVLGNPVGASDFAVFSFFLFEKQKVAVELFDAKGALVRSLLAETEIVEGAHQMVIEGRDLAAGTYFVRLKTREENQMAKLVRL